MGDFWRFDSISTQWTLLTTPSSVGGPSARAWHSVFGITGTGKIVVLFGSNAGYRSDAFVYTIASQQWASIPGTSIPVRDSHVVAVDERNMGYFYGGQSTGGGRIQLKKIPLLQYSSVVFII